MTSSSNWSSSYFLRKIQKCGRYSIDVRAKGQYEKTFSPRMQSAQGAKSPVWLNQEGKNRRHAQNMYSKQSLARYFGVSLSTIQRLIQKGEIEAIHIGRSVRITEKAVAKFIASQRGAR
jgi:excisionase family DNA binding protein